MKSNSLTHTRYQVSGKRRAVVISTAQGETHQLVAWAWEVGGIQGEQS